MWRRKSSPGIARFGANQAAFLSNGRRGEDGESPVLWGLSKAIQQVSFFSQSSFPSILVQRVESVCCCRMGERVQPRSAGYKKCAFALDPIRRRDQVLVQGDDN